MWNLNFHLSSVLYVENTVKCQRNIKHLQVKQWKFGVEVLNSR